MDFKSIFRGILRVIINSGQGRASFPNLSIKYLFISVVFAISCDIGPFYIFLIVSEYTCAVFIS